MTRTEKNNVIYFDFKKSNETTASPDNRFADFVINTILEERSDLALWIESKASALRAQDISGVLKFISNYVDERVQQTLAESMGLTFLQLRRLLVMLQFDWIDTGKHDFPIFAINLGWSSVDYQILKTVVDFSDHGC
jgi:hypothetical protein